MANGNREHEKFVDLVTRMRSAQARWFAAKKTVDLIEAKKFERDVDRWIAQRISDENVHSGFRDKEEPSDCQS